MNAETQEILDQFYWKNGPCCAGCDHWRPLSAFVGECEKSTLHPVAVEPRRRYDGGVVTTLRGRNVTERHHRCEAFEDSFPWQAMPLPYLECIGALSDRRKVEYPRLERGGDGEFAT